MARMLLKAILCSPVWYSGEKNVCTEKTLSYSAYWQLILSPLCFKLSRSSCFTSLPLVGLKLLGIRSFIYPLCTSFLSLFHLTRSDRGHSLFQLNQSHRPFEPIVLLLSNSNCSIICCYQLPLRCQIKPSSTSFTSSSHYVQHPRVHWANQQSCSTSHQHFTPSPKPPVSGLGLDLKTKM